MDLIAKEQKIALQFPKEDKIVEMSCVIENVYNDRLDVVLPQYFMRYIQYLQVGTSLIAKIFTKIGTIDFNTVVISSPLEDTFTIEFDYNAIKLCPDTEQATIDAVVDVELSSNSGNIMGKTISVSADGIKIKINTTLAIDDTYDFKLFLPKEFGVIQFKGIISELDDVYDDEYTVTFSMITEVHKQLLLYYMYIYEKNLSN